MRMRCSRTIAGAALVVCASIGAAAPLINGAGATFPYPIYSKWFDEYHKKTGVRINYQSIGSGGGIRQVLEGTVDFGATDGPMSDEQLGQAKTPILHFPTVLGAVVATFNLPGVEKLRLTPETLTGIFLGKITSWNDPALAKDNPGVALPAQAIVPVHRSDGSGTTYVFVDFLSKVSPEWAKTVGKNTAFLIHLVQQVGGLVGLHLFHDVGGALVAEGFQHFGLKFGVEFFERVGDLFIVETADQFSGHARAGVFEDFGDVSRMQFVHALARDVDAQVAARQEVQVAPRDFARGQRAAHHARHALGEVFHAEAAQQPALTDVHVD